MSNLRRYEDAPIKPKQSPLAEAFEEPARAFRAAEKPRVTERVWEPLPMLGIPDPPRRVPEYPKTPELPSDPYPFVSSEKRNDRSGFDRFLEGSLRILAFLAALGAFGCVCYYFGYDEGYHDAKHAHRVSKYD